jgi:uncharacterized protein
MATIHRGIEARFEGAVAAISPVKILRATALAVVLAFVGPPGGPLQAQVEGTPSSEAIEAARDLLALMSRDMLAQLVGKATAQMWLSIEPRLRAYNPNIDTAALAELRKELERVQLEYMMNIVKDGPSVYARHFTAEELREIIAFYRTPTGDKVLRMTPQLTAEVMAMIAPHMPDFHARTIEVFTKVLRSRGYNL